MLLAQPDNRRTGRGIARMVETTEGRAELTVLVGLKSHTEISFRPRRDAQAQRAEQVEAFLPLVRSIAERLHRCLPPGLDLESLVQAGAIGLLEALDRYDPARGAFPAYAGYRIRGEMIEHLRSLDGASRSTRAWGRKAAAARTRLTARLGREVSAAEMATELGVSLPQYYKADRQLHDAAVVSFDPASPASEEGWEKAQEAFSQGLFQNPLSLLESKDLIGKLTAALEELSDRERLVMALYYHEELTLREIGEVLNLTEGRISQLHGQALSRLRHSLGVAA
jgi:RNA polymerase sigma factor FliA